MLCIAILRRKSPGKTMTCDTMTAKCHDLRRYMLCIAILCRKSPGKTMTCDTMTAKCHDLRRYDGKMPYRK